MSARLVQGHELIDVANQVAVDRDTDAEFFPMFTNSDFPSEMELLTERQSHSADIEFYGYTWIFPQSDDKH